MLPPGERVTAQDIAKRRLIPSALVRRVITQLANAGLVTTARGSNGGLSLARPASEISLLDVVQSDGRTARRSTRAPVNPQACPLMQVCSVHQVWVEARAALMAKLNQSTFDKLAQGGAVLFPSP